MTLDQSDYVQANFWTQLKGSMDAYNMAIKLLTDTVKIDIPPELLNNIGSLYFRLGNYEKAIVKFPSN